MVATTVLKLCVYATLALVMVACGSSTAPASTATKAAAAGTATAPVQTAPAATPQQAAPGQPPATQPLVLKHASTLVQDLGVAQAQVWFWKEVEQRSRGRVKVEFYWAESLAKSADILDAVSSGLADIGEVIPGYHPAKTPLGTIQTLPFLHVTGLEMAAASNAVLGGLPEARAELDKFGVKYIFSGGMDSYSAFSKKPLRTLDDLKGLKVRGYGELNTWTSSAGGTAVAMTFPEIYTGLERGMVDAALHVYSMARAYKWQEVVEYVTEAKMGAVGNYEVLMNGKTWGKLPPDVQTIVVDMAQKEWPQKELEYIRMDEDKSIKEVLAAKVEKIELAPAEWARWQALASPIWDKWVENMEKQGLAGKKVFAAWQAAVKATR